LSDSEVDRQVDQKADRSEVRRLVIDSSTTSYGFEKLSLKFENADVRQSN